VPVGVAVVLDALHERRRAVAHAEDCDTHLVAHLDTSLISCCRSTSPAGEASPPGMPAALVALPLATRRTKLRRWAAMASRSSLQNTSRPSRRVLMTLARRRVRRCQLI